jgi:hypothetical protein
MEGDREMAKIETARNATRENATTKRAFCFWREKRRSKEGMCTIGGISPSVQSGKFGDGLKIIQLGKKNIAQ